jgi:uridine phosphorylase
MAVIKNKYPILEYDESRHSIIEPNRKGNYNFPKYCVITFFGEVLEKYIENNYYEKICEYRTEMKKIPIYKIRHNNLELCIVQAVVGSASIAIMTDILISGGAKYIIACGACGVLDNISPGNVFIPTAALRDEGASYHYLQPKREINLDNEIIEIIELILNNGNVPYRKCKTWTTDGFYRETEEMVQYRKEEGCLIVEMECATMAAVSKFRGIKFGQLLYSGDVVMGESKYDDRKWFENLSAREKLYYLSLDIISEIRNKKEKM